MKLVKKIFFCILFTLVSFNTNAQLSDVQKNTEMYMLGLKVFTLNNDSIRIHYKNKTYIDLFLNKELIWNIKKYSKDSILLNTGNFKDGSGNLTININGYHYECSFKNGEFDGDFLKYYINRNDKYILCDKCHYDLGICNGTYSHYIYSKKNWKYSEIDYVDGEKVAHRTYGEYIPFLYTIGQIYPIFLIVRNHDKLCKEEFFENGNSLHSDYKCYTKIKHCDCP